MKCQNLVFWGKIRNIFQCMISSVENFTQSALSRSFAIQLSSSQLKCLSRHLSRSTRLHVRPAKTHITLRIRAVLLESSHEHSGGSQ